MGAANATKPGAELIAWYLNPDRLPVARRWSRKHGDTQRRLCERYAVPVINAVACQDITVGHVQKYLPDPAEPAHCIDFVLTVPQLKAETMRVLFAGKQLVQGRREYLSDHVGLYARLHPVAD
jgi:hypothetical protein